MLVADIESVIAEKVHLVKLQKAGWLHAPQNRRLIKAVFIRN